MGAYSFVSPRIEHLLPKSSKLKYIGRPPAAAPATGIGKMHKQEQKKILNFWSTLDD